MNPERLKKLRKQNGYTQAELARELGVGISTVAMWESGKRVPAFKQIKAMCGLYKCTLEYLTGDSDQNAQILLVAIVVVADDGKNY